MARRPGHPWTTRRYADQLNGTRTVPDDALNPAPMSVAHNTLGRRTTCSQIPTTVAVLGYSSRGDQGVHPNIRDGGP